MLSAYPVESIIFLIVNVKASLTFGYDCCDWFYCFYCLF